MMVPVRVPVQRSDDFRNVMRRFNLLVELGQIRRRTEVVNDAVEFVQRVLLGMLEVFFVMFDVIENFFDFVLDRKSVV